MLVEEVEKKVETKTVKKEIYDLNNIKEELDFHIIDKITKFLPNGLVFKVAKNCMNKRLSKILFSNCFQVGLYLFAYDPTTPKVYSLPSMKEIVIPGMPSIDLMNYDSISIKNFGIIYNTEEKFLHLFQLNPLRYVKLDLKDSLNDKSEAYFISNNSFHLVSKDYYYKVEDMKVTKSIKHEMSSNNDIVIIGDYLVNDGFGDSIKVININTEKVYEYKFEFGTHFTVISKDMIAIDLTEGNETSLYPENSIVEAEDIMKLRNTILNMSFVEPQEGETKGKIAFSFEAFISDDLEIKRFNTENAEFYSINVVDQNITLYRRTKEIATIDLKHDTHLFEIATPINDTTLLVEFNTYLLIIDFTQGKIVHEVNLKEKFPEIHVNVSTEPCGIMFLNVMLRDQVELGAWRHWILDPDFNRTIEIKQEEYFVFHD